MKSLKIKLTKILNLKTAKVDAVKDDADNNENIPQVADIA